MLAAKDAGYDLTGKKMTLLGAGGAATSILVQAALDGLAEISVFVPQHHVAAPVAHDADYEPLDGLHLATLINQWTVASIYV